MNMVCCDAKGGMMAFIGISEKKMEQPPSRVYSSDTMLPSDVMNAYDSFNIRLFEGVEKGMGAEDDTEVHALMKYPPTHPYQQRMIAYANLEFALLKDVLETSGKADHREAASWIIAYHTDKQAVANVLQSAIDDPDANVRNNVVRGISVLADYSLKKNVPIVLSPDPFIRLMNSISWTDRNKSASVLMTLTAKKDRALLDRLRNEALDPLKDMAMWTSAGHAMPGFIMLARIAGWSDGQMMDGMKMNRQEVVKQLLSDIRKRK